MINMVAEKSVKLENILANLDLFPLDALYRTALGFVIFPAASRLEGGAPSGRIAVVLLLAALLMVRLAPAVVRRMVPFPQAVRDVWARRRQLAKRYDSYQWRKLFWVGSGLALYTVFSGQLLTYRIVMPALCMSAGAIGWLRWKSHAAPGDSDRGHTKPVRRAA